MSEVHVLPSHALQREPDGESLVEIIINDEDIPHPSASFYLHGTGTGSDGSQIRFTTRGHFVLDKRTGEVRRNTIISTCRVS